MSHTYRDVLNDGIRRLRNSGAEEPEADARVLFDEAFQMDAAKYLLSEREPAPYSGILRYKACLWQRESGRSVQQILCRQLFLNLFRRMYSLLLQPWNHFRRLSLSQSRQKYSQLRQ